MNSLTYLGALLEQKHDRAAALLVVDIAMLSGSRLCSVDGREMNVLMRQR